MDKKIKISVIIPCYRSEKYLEETVEEILQSFQKHGEFVPELILVDDHSPDGTAAVVEKLGDRPGITAVCLTENLGQARAKLQGVSCASGDAAVFMDDDGQHDPEGIFLLLDKLDLRSFSSGRNGLHLVYAQFPKKRKPAKKSCKLSYQSGFMRDDRKTRKARHHQLLRGGQGSFGCPEGVSKRKTFHGRLCLALFWEEIGGGNPDPAQEPGVWKLYLFSEKTDQNLLESEYLHAGDPPLSQTVLRCCLSDRLGKAV